jgi:tetratricopeptide (TPR) repeat protein
LLAQVARDQVLPREAATELEAFPPRVKDLLAAAYVLLGDDPADALRYASEAKRMAGRRSIVREAVGVVAYHAGNYELAAKELRAARRISGLDTLVPLIADCERALGHPERALALAEEDLSLDRDNRVELRIVAAGARMDLGQPEAAQLLLRGRLLDSEDQTPASARLKYAYAEALLSAGDGAAARDWFLRSAQADLEGDTDAEERAVTLLEGDAQ